MVRHPALQFLGEQDQLSRPVRRRQVSSCLQGGTRAAETLRWERSLVKLNSTGPTEAFVAGRSKMRTFYVWITQSASTSFAICSGPSFESSKSNMKTFLTLERLIFARHVYLS